MRKKTYDGNSFKQVYIDVHGPIFVQFTSGVPIHVALGTPDLPSFICVVHRQ